MYYVLSVPGSLPTKSTTPDRLRPWAKTESEDFPGFGVRTLSKNFFSKGPCSLVVIYTPKEAHSRSFVTGGSVIAWQMLAKFFLWSWRGELVSICNIRTIFMRDIGSCVLLLGIIIVDEDMAYFIYMIRIAEGEGSAAVYEDRRAVPNSLRWIDDRWEMNYTSLETINVTYT